MKNLLLCSLALICFSCSPPGKQEPSLEGGPVLQEPFDWLLGFWIRTKDRPGYTTYEHWEKKSSTEYLGSGYTLRFGDTIFKEQLRLVKSNDIWNFEASDVNEDPTIFLVIEQGANSFECENKENRFPKNIRYSLQDNFLVAEMSDGSTSFRFDFENADH